MSTTKRRRPTWVTLIALLASVFGMMRLIRAARRLQEAEWYAALGVSFPIWPDAILSAAWGAVLLALGWGLWRLHPWACRAAPGILTAHIVFSLAWLALFARSDYDTGRLPFAALMSLGEIAWIWFIFTRRRIRDAFTATGGPNDPP